jgi:RHS repeat-associated protein
MFGARYYGSSLGRFMTPDWAAKPISVPYADFGNPQSLNLYSYVKNNPTTTRDADGHCGEDLCIVEGGAAIYIGGAALLAGTAAILNTPAGQRSLSTFTSAAGQSISNSISAISSFFHPNNSGQNAPPPATTPTNVSQGTPGTTATNVATGTPASTSQQGAVDASPMQQYAGNNIVQGSGRVNSDLPGGQAEAAQKFGELTAGQGTSVDARTGHTVADDGTRLRNNADGTARIDRPASVTGDQHETVHFNQPNQPNQ